MVEAVKVRLASLVLLALPSVVRAHQLDEYLQSTLVVIEPASIRLQMILTPGVSIAEKVLALMDGNADGVLSTEEGAAYAALLKRELSLQLDTQDLELKLTASDIPTPAELRTGAGIMQMEFTAVPDTIAAGPHTLTLRNRHLPSVSVYLINAAKPKTATIQINRQTRIENQSAGEIAYTFQPPADSSQGVERMAALAGLLAAAVGWWLLRKSRAEKTR
ncbi:hypothetical protein [Prosthecobacter sp.]|uniref:hypothetical protein n=1 Tax=Prosthecobacter sp. TaxID=1965333 RepID=UPI003784E2DA